MWMPENIWGRFSVTARDTGFKVEGDYYRRGGHRNDSYHLYEDGSGLILLDPQELR